MDKKWFRYLRCPECGFSNFKIEEVIGVMVCVHCRKWFLVEDGVMELVPEILNWERKLDYYRRFEKKMRLRRLSRPGRHKFDRSVRYKNEQEQFFDKFFVEEKSKYQESSFWKAEYYESLCKIKNRVKKGDMLIDAGCGEGACSFILKKPGLLSIGFDISRESVKKAIDRSLKLHEKKEMLFFVGDVEHPPLNDGIGDEYVIFAVLHHVLNPMLAVKEAKRILRSGGRIFIHDNNASGLRWVFDLLMKMFPLWKEKAAKENKFSILRMRNLLNSYFEVEGIKTSVFLPPHVFNLFHDAVARMLLKFSDRIGNTIPKLKNNGGIIKANARKR